MLYLLMTQMIFLWQYFIQVISLFSARVMYNSVQSFVFIYWIKAFEYISKLLCPYSKAT